MERTSDPSHPPPPPRRHRCRTRRASSPRSIRRERRHRAPVANPAERQAERLAHVAGLAGRQPAPQYYGRGEDEIWGRPIGMIGFGPDVLHDVRSVSKSVVALVYGIALAAGKVPPPDAKLYELFPDYRDLAGPDRDRLTIHHALSMTLGLEWDELSVSYDNPRNSAMVMEAAPDRLRFVLERPIVGEPGVKWTYCGGATALLAHLIAKGTGETLL